MLERGRKLGVIFYDDLRSVVQAIHMLCSGWAMGADYLGKTDKETYWRQIAALVEGRFFDAERRARRKSKRRCRLTMELYDRRTLEGVYSVRQSAGFIMNYRYAEERMMRMMAGWIALTPEIPVKLEMARQVYECALHADALGKRLGELRSQAQVSRPPNEAFVTFISAIEDKEQWEDTIERVAGIYRVLKPHLVAHYSAHVTAANPVYEPPTLRILAHLVDDEKRHIERGLVLLDKLLDTPEKHRRAASWQAQLEELLAASGGVTGMERDREEPQRLGRSR